MRFIKKTLRKWLLEESDESGYSVKSAHEENSVDDDPILSFRIFSASNGKILEFRTYDRVKDRSIRSLYIIGKDEDIAHKVSKCLSLELLK